MAKDDFDWDDAETEVLTAFITEFVNKTNADYEMVGRALVQAYLALPAGKQKIKD